MIELQTAPPPPAPAVVDGKEKEQKQTLTKLEFPTDKKTHAILSGLYAIKAVSRLATLNLPDSLPEDHKEAIKTFVLLLKSTGAILDLQAMMKEPERTTAEELIDFATYLQGFPEYTTISKNVEEELKEGADPEIIIQHVRSVIHDMNTPLTAAKGNAQLGERVIEKQNVQAAERNYSVVKSSFQRFSQFLDNMDEAILDVNKVEEIKAREFRNVVHKSFVDTILAANTFKFYPDSSDQLQIGYEPEDLPALKVLHYIPRTQRLFENIAKNIVEQFEIRNKLFPQRTYEPKRVQVKFEYENGFLKVIVEDNATGFSQDVLNNGFRQGVSQKGEGRGTGMAANTQVLREKYHGDYKLENIVDENGNVVGGRQIYFIPAN